MNFKASPQLPAALCICLALASAASAAESKDDPNTAPALHILFGARSMLSFVGIATLIIGVWRADRRWDEMGSAAYHREAAKMASSSTGRDSKVTIPEKDLDAAFPFPWMFLLGWILVAVSFLFSPNERSEIETYPSNILGCFFSLVLGVVASTPMGDAVRNRKPKKKKVLGLLFMLSWVMLAVFTGLHGEDNELRNMMLNLDLSIVGAILIIVSMRILWTFRKMGDSWEQDGKPAANSDISVYNLGGPFFVFGFFVFWLGLASKTNDEDPLETLDCTTEDCGLPIFFSIRSAVAFFGGCGMVPIVMMADYAHDEGSEFVGFGTEGKYFGRFFESPIPFVTMWTLFGFAGFFSLDNEFSLVDQPRTWVCLFLCVAQGIVAGIKIQSALYKGDMKGKAKWSLPFALMFVILGINLGFKADYSGLNGGGLGLALGLPGALLVIIGQKTVFGDRKRGDYFMQNDGAENPNPIVYSAGEPIFMFGWILLSVAMSYNF